MQVNCPDSIENGWTEALQFKCTWQGKERQSYSTLYKPSDFQQHNYIVDGSQAA